MSPSRRRSEGPGRGRDLVGSSDGGMIGTLVPVQPLVGPYSSRGDPRRRSTVREGALPLYPQKVKRPRRTDRFWCQDPPDPSGPRKLEPGPVPW